MKPGKTKSRTGFFTKLLIVLHGGVVLALLISYLAPFVNPASFWPIAFLGIAYPFLLLLNLIFIIYWLVAGRYKFALVAFLVILIGWRTLTSTFGFRAATAVAGPREDVIKVMTYNVHYFKKFDYQNNKEVRDEILDVIRDEKPDLICFQEYMTRKKGELNLTKAIRKITGYKYYALTQSNKNDFELVGLGVFSRYPIKRKEDIVFKNNLGGNEAMCTDIEYRGKQFRVYNVHFQSIGFQPEDYKYLKEVKEINKEDYRSTRRIMARLKNAFIKRAEQVKQIKAHTLECKIPFVVAGDFNDTPASYAVNQMSAGLKNSFREKGSGFAITYNGAFPNFQIDYILTSQDFDVKSYRIVKKALSDHYAVRSDLQLK